MSNKLNIIVNARSEGLTIKNKAGKHEFIIDEGKQMGGRDLGPNPLQAVLGALAACENVTARVVAREMNFDFKDMELKISGKFDPRGFMGSPHTRPYFEAVKVDVKIMTTEPEGRINELQHKVESRCPVYTMLKAAQVEMIDSWQKA
ncbi:OsmC family protein [Cytobacillus sp. IB215665]|uniref:OsmC family protein n=1 Tax=Cytobacillus sp. IB215665 TaxID=3097357 RepID=UPI002A0DC9EF|nr:OsmC family protein [Cytobacillus sp. IB215665]MDX8366336.1 OsmC family protein [Cytobacillus sp. IB215665]